MMATRAPDPAFCSVHDKLGLLYFIEASNSISAILLVVGLSFYTTHRFGWGARENFTLAALQGALYMVGALFARSVSQRWGRERSLLGLYAGMTVFAVAVGISATMGWAMAVALLAVLETGLLAVSWPMLQSLVSAAGKPSQLSKRLGLYNIIWSGLGAIAVAGSGAIIQHAPAWAFFGIIAAGHFAAGLLVLHRARHRSSSADSSPGDSGNEARISPPKSDQATLHRHRLALWLSRIALPSTYVVVYSISPALPSLHAIKQLTPTVATLVGSVWLLGRAGAFIITGSTIFWHKRPGLIFLSSITMLFAFVGTIVPGGAYRN